MSAARYRSALREEQADETRRRIRSAARELFEQTGFTATTVAGIARRAGVSPATVYANFESKAGLVVAMLEEMEEQAGLGERIGEMLAEDDPLRCLGIFVAGNRALYEHSHVILRAAFDALGNPEVRTLAETGDANRRRGVETLVARWYRQGALVPGLGPTRAADTMWLLTSAEQYLLAVDSLGWSPAAYERWLRELLAGVLFGPAQDG